jgi:hypothetical protein
VNNELKEFGKKQFQPTLRYHPRICLVLLNETTKIFIWNFKTDKPLNVLVFCLRQKSRNKNDFISSLLSLGKMLGYLMLTTLSPSLG